MFEGTVAGFRNVGASVVVVDFQDGRSVYAEGRMTIQAFEDAFGSLEESIGQRVEYQYTDFGTLAGFTPL